MIAINDGNLLKPAIYILLKKHFGNHPAYLKMVESFNEVAFLTELGQECDGIASQQRLGQWTMKQYHNITQLKGGYYSFYLSVLLGLQYLGLDTAANIKITQDILIPLGKFYQFQNDSLDIFGEVSRTGKLGADIQENKCSWVAIEAWEMCDESDKRTISENDGQPDQEAARKVQKIFSSLPLMSIYKMEERELFEGLRKRIEGIDENDGLNRAIFDTLLSCVQGLA